MKTNKNGTKKEETKEEVKQEVKKEYIYNQNQLEEVKKLADRVTLFCKNNVIDESGPLVANTLSTIVEPIDWRKYKVDRQLQLELITQIHKSASDKLLETNNILPIIYLVHTFILNQEHPEKIVDARTNCLTYARLYKFSLPKEYVKKDITGKMAVKTKQEIVLEKLGIKSETKAEIKAEIKAEPKK